MHEKFADFSKIDILFASLYNHLSEILKHAEEVNLDPIQTSLNSFLKIESVIKQASN